MKGNILSIPYDFDRNLVDKLVKKNINIDNESPKDWTIDEVIETFQDGSIRCDLVTYYGTARTTNPGIIISRAQLKKWSK